MTQSEECSKVDWALWLTHKATDDRTMGWSMYCIWLDLYLEREFR